MKAKDNNSERVTLRLGLGRGCGTGDKRVVREKRRLQGRSEDLETNGHRGGVGHGTGDAGDLMDKTGQ